METKVIEAVVGVEGVDGAEAHENTKVKVGGVAVAQV